MNSAPHITQRDLGDSAMLFAALHRLPTFRAHDFAEFMDVAAFHLDEELANDVLLQVVAEGNLREIGPGVYALIERSGDDYGEQPLWPEDAP